MDTRAPSPSPPKHPRHSRRSRRSRRSLRCRRCRRSVFCLVYTNIFSCEASREPSLLTLRIKTRPSPLVGWSTRSTGGLHGGPRRDWCHRGQPSVAGHYPHRSWIGTLSCSGRLPVWRYCVNCPQRTSTNLTNCCFRFFSS